MIKITSNGERDFCLLNLTDTQLKSEEWDNNNQTGKIFKKTTQTLINRVSPDLITLSGDLSYAGDFESYKNFADYFDSFKIPWTCCFGNHDNQDGDGPIQKVIDEYLKHKFFVYEKCDSSLGNSNFTILLEKDGKNAEGIILMDTHDREFYTEDDKEKFHWDKLSKKQLIWYKEQIEMLKSVGCNDTTLITHIPINAYSLAFKAAFNSELLPKSVKLEDCRNEGVWNKGYEDSYGVDHEPISCYPHDDGVFDLIKESGSTKTIICGHNHINNWIINYEGVKFIFALKTGCGSYWEPSLNGGTVIKVNKNGVTAVNHEYVDVSDML